jgi:hypothetical protein
MLFVLGVCNLIAGYALSGPLASARPLALPISKRNPLGWFRSNLYAPSPILFRLVSTMSDPQSAAVTDLGPDQPQNPNPEQSAPPPKPIYTPSELSQGFRYHDDRLRRVERMNNEFEY